MNDSTPFRGELERRLGAQSVVGAARYTRNVSGFRRLVAFGVRPRDVDEVALVLDAARRHGVALHPISRGANWGLGSALPVRDGCVVLDLGRMDAIRHVDTATGYAIVEPGVTQQQLADELRRRDAPFVIDVTGSGAGTSIVGNCLERGTGYNATRIDSVLAFEVMLADGGIVRTGLWTSDGPAAHPLTQHGLGPSVTGVFTQSGLGVVLAATVALVPRPGHHRVVLLGTTERAGLAELVDTVAELRAAGLLDSVVHIADAGRAEHSLAPQAWTELRRTRSDATAADARRAVRPLLRSGWSAIGAIAGDPRVVRARIACARRRLRPGITFRAVGIDQVARLARGADALRLRRTAAALHAVRPLLGLTAGTPTNATLSAVGWGCARQPDGPGAPDLDAGEAGLLYLVPAARFTGRDAVRLERLCRSTADACGVDVAITLNTLSAFVLEGVVSVSFRRGSATESERAHGWLQRTRQAFLDAGFPCLRLDVGSLADGAFSRYPAACLADRLKEALDPTGTIAPGRYATP